MNDAIKFQDVIVNSGRFSQYILGNLVIDEIRLISLLVYSPPRRSKETDNFFDENDKGTNRMVARSSKGSHAER